MQLNDVFIALKDLSLASFREPSLLWQLAPVIVLWFVLIIYFSTHKKEELGWNTSLTNGITLFWVVMGTMQYIFSNNKEFFTWIKFGIFSLVALYALFIIYVSFKHSLSAKATYLIASQNPVLYFSMLTILFAYDMIYLSWAMLIAVVIFFFGILLLEFILIKLLPEMKENEGDDSSDSSDSFDSFDSSTDSFDDGDDDIFGKSSGGIEDSMGDNLMAENHTKW